MRSNAFNPWVQFGMASFGGAFPNQATPYDTGAQQPQMWQSPMDAFRNMGMSQKPVGNALAQGESPLGRWKVLRHKYQGGSR